MKQEKLAATPEGGGQPENSAKNEMLLTPFKDSRVRAKFEAYPPLAREDLLALRELVFAVASETPRVGPVDESLRWNEPAYLTPSGSGSIIRMDWKARSPEKFGLYFHCQTGLVETFRALFPHDFQFEGNRALLLNVGQSLPKDALAFCIAAALTYHRAKRAAKPLDPATR